MGRLVAGKARCPSCYYKQRPVARVLPFSVDGVEIHRPRMKRAVAMVGPDGADEPSVIRITVNGSDNDDDTEVEVIVLDEGDEPTRSTSPIPGTSYGSGPSILGNLNRDPSPPTNSSDSLPDLVIEGTSGYGTVEYSEIHNMVCFSPTCTRPGCTASTRARNIESITNVRQTVSRVLNSSQQVVDRSRVLINHANTLGALMRRGDLEGIRRFGESSSLELQGGSGIPDSPDSPDSGTGSESEEVVVDSDTEYSSSTGSATGTDTESDDSDSSWGRRVVHLSPDELDIHPDSSSDESHDASPPV